MSPPQTQARRMLRQRSISKLRYGSNFFDNAHRLPTSHIAHLILSRQSGGRDILLDG